MKLSFWNKDVGIQHYTYDHNGIRILKSSAREVGVYEGGELIGTELEMDPYTVYVNPYFVATHYANEVEASKHYYMGTQRIATGLINYPFVGEEDTNDPDPEPGGGQPESGNNTSYGATINLQAVLLAFGKTNGVDYQINDLLTMPAITGYSYDNQTAFNAAVDDVNENEIRETPCEEDPLCLCELSRHWAWVTYGIDCSDQRVMYWYHPDYLGNTEFITDLNGNPYQFFLYSPWGESLESHHKHNNQMAFAYDSPYRFNAKELDAETGNYYYGARYYDPKVSVWLSVDPLAHKYPGLSPYVFSGNNPINLVDPDGRWVPGLDENGNITLTAEKGDNAKTLIEFFGDEDNAHKYVEKSATNEKTEYSKGSTVTFKKDNNFSKTMDYYNNNKEKFEDGESYDCKELCRQLVLNERPIENSDPHTGTPEANWEFGKDYYGKREEIDDPSQHKFGETFSTTLLEGHAAIYFGQDNNGNSYYFSKNGKGGPLVITTESKLSRSYWTFGVFSYRKK